MTRRARWIRLECGDPRRLQAVGCAFPQAQARDAAPVVLWSGLEPEVDGLCDGPQFGYVFVAPVHLAPGKTARWPAWALCPAIAAYRDFGLRAYLDGSDVCVKGRRVGRSHAATVCGCAVISSSLGAGFRRQGLLPQTETGATAFRAWLREGLGLALSQWASDGDAPSERVLEAALRARIEAQHGWQFENSWPNAPEQRAIDAAQRAPLGRDAGLELSA